MLFYQLVNFENVLPRIVKKIRSDFLLSAAQGYRWVEWHEEIRPVVLAPDISIVYAKDMEWRRLLGYVNKAKSPNVILLGNTSGEFALPYFVGDFDIQNLNTYMRKQLRHLPNPRKPNSQAEWVETVPLPLETRM